MKKYQRLADAFTPLAKGMNSEYCNQSAYDCIQIHGGSGYMQEYKCQRLYRDARITSIYEGTTQLQVVAALRYITNGTYLNVINDLNAELDERVNAVEDGGKKSEFLAYVERINEMKVTLEDCVEFVKLQDNQDVLDFCGRKLYEITAYTIMCQLLLLDTVRCQELFGASLVVFFNHAEAEVARHSKYVHGMNADVLASYVRS